MNTNLISVSTKTQTQTKMNSKACPKCGCEMYAYCEPADEGGCFFETATEEQLDEVIKRGLSNPNWRPTSGVMMMMMKQNKTRNDKIWLALSIEDIINPADEDSDSEDEDSEDDEMPELISINAQ